MIQTTDLVQVEYKDGKPKFHGTFQRPYFTFGPEDELETSVKKIKTQNDGDVEYTLTSPKKDAKTKYTATQLFQQALQYFTAKQELEVSDPAKRVDPLFLILEGSESAETAKARMSRTAELKPKDMDKAIQACAKNLMAAYPGKFTMEKALDKAKSYLQE